MAERTSTPWAARTDTVDEYGHVNILDCDYNWVATCRESNADLIAASPDLLEACRAAMVFVQDWHPAHWQLLDAIDKAEGPR